MTVHNAFASGEASKQEENDFLKCRVLDTIFLKYGVEEEQIKKVMYEAHNATPSFH